MEKGFKTMAIVAMLVAIVGVSVGFAAFTKTFTTASFNANVAANSDAFASGLTMTASSGNGTVSGNTWTIGEVSVTDLSKAYEYTATFDNATPYVAYLSSASSSKLTCAAAPGAEVSTASLNEICNKVTVTVSFDGTTLGTMNITTGFTKTNASGSRTSYSVPAISGSTHGLKNTKVSIAFTSSYKPDGDVIVTIPAITYTFTSIQ